MTAFAGQDRHLDFVSAHYVSVGVDELDLINAAMSADAVIEWTRMVRLQKAPTAS